MSDDPFEWEGMPAGAAPAPPPQARRSGRAAWLGAVAIAAAVAAALGVVLTSGSSTPSLGSNTIAQAASVTSATAGYRFSLTMAASAAGQSVAVHATGSATERPEPEASMTMVTGGQGIQAVDAPPWVYLAVDGAW